MESNRERRLRWFQELELYEHLRRGKMQEPVIQKIVRLLYEIPYVDLIECNFSKDEDLNKLIHNQVIHFQHIIENFYIRKEQKRLGLPLSETGLCGCDTNQ